MKIPILAFDETLYDIFLIPKKFEEKYYHHLVCLIETVTDLNMTCTSSVSEG